MLVLVARVASLTLASAAAVAAGVQEFERALIRKLFVFDLVRCGWLVSNAVQPKQFAKLTQCLGGVWAQMNYFTWFFVVRVSVCRPALAPTTSSTYLLNPHPFTTRWHLCMCNLTWGTS